MAHARLHHQHLRRLAEAATSTSVSTANITTSKVNLTDIALYATGLNGVNQGMNNICRDALWWSLGILGMIILVVRLSEAAHAHLRHMVAMSSTAAAQEYWRNAKNSWLPDLKRHLLYAPLWNKRHNREIQLSSALNMGTLPSRLHTLLLYLFILSNFGYMAALNYNVADHYSVVAELRGRSGDLAVVNMIALVILAGRNNPLITLLKISFDTYNLLHRWIGRTVVLEAVVHTIAWAYVKIAAAGWSGAWEMLGDSTFIQSGMVGTVAFVLLLVLSPSPLRHAFYETFLGVHIVLATAAIIGTWIHCEVASLPQLPYVKTIVVLWIADRVARLTRIVYCNYSRASWTTASIECLPSKATRVTMHLPNYLDVKPGTHAYLRIAGLNPWESHPFSIAWVQHIRNNLVLPVSDEKDFPAALKEDPSNLRTDISFVIQAQTGFTKKLFDKAASVSPRLVTLKAAFEGPYAGHHSMDSYGTAVLIAGASGITHQIPFIRHLLEGHNAGTVATRRITLIWVVRDVEQLEWVRPWMDTILRLPNRREILNIKLFVTRPKSPREICSPSSTVQMFPGRPDICLLVRNEVKEQIGAMCVTICGPGSLADNVREAVREVQNDTVVDFIEESFTW
ncbi:ferric-chelate reductase-like protein FreB [Coleophoma crateriformis]|uniref:ferric-chelate reductase (NADPH) n=1 Tax=Coleophoma crateriformis TaxID=565419 RepID=A0A3D8T3M4_9HELO|nr:ferric-chelate reductase-like protein FreB [Coleophoma crateriformis]